MFAHLRAELHKFAIPARQLVAASTRFDFWAERFKTLLDLRRPVSPWRSIAIAILAIAGAIFIREIVLAGLGSRLAYLTFYVPLMVAALAGGVLAGAIAAALTVLATSLWLAPPTDMADWLGLAAFLINAALITALTEAMHRARARAVRAQDGLQEMIEQASEGIFVANAEGHCIDVNSACCDMFGYARDEMLRCAITDMVMQDELPRLEQGIRNLRAGEMSVGDWRFRRKDGTLFLGEVSAKKFSDGRLQGFIRDATERRRAEAALRESEARLRLFFEHAPAALAMLSLDMSYVHASRRWLSDYGLGDMELRGLSHYDIFDTIPDRWREIHRRAMAGEVIRAEEDLFVRASGQAQWLRWEVRPWYESGGQCAGIAIFSEDITERKEAQQRQLELVKNLQQSEITARQQQALFRGIFDNAPEGIVLLDTSRRVVMVNQAFNRIFGYAATELIGSPFSKLHAHEENFTDVGAQAAPEPKIVRCRRGNGETFPARITMVPCNDAVDRLIGHIGIMGDATSDLKREEERRQTQQLESLGRLSGGLAHDLNNLLTVISGNLQLLEMSLDDGKLKRYLHEAELAAEMGARINNRLMTFARQRRLSPIATNLNNQVSRVLELLRRMLGEDIMINADLADDLWPALVDPGEVESAILNLAINARHAMPKGGTLRIETANVVSNEDEVSAALGPGEYVRLSVTDTGSGMSPDVLAHAFEPFFTTKEPGKGTGLGLASVYGFVRQSGGYVSLQSEERHGTIANIYLPKLDADAAKDGGLQDNAEPAQGRGETILVVEDNPDVRRVAVARLEQLGYKILQADSGAGAIALLQTGISPDLVFSDVVMPGGMSGFELARRIAELRPLQKILLTSGFSGENECAGENEGGGLPILHKPYSRSELGRSVRAALERPAPDDQPRVMSATNV